LRYKINLYVLFTVSSPAGFFSDTYGFGPGVGGLAYLGLGVGFATATIFGAKFADQVYQYVSISPACLPFTVD
jgi:hypothetical protein